MNIRKLRLMILTILGSLAFTATAWADTFYEVTITNLTKGMYFTPILVASTRWSENIFELGEVASSELETIAETGDYMPLEGSLDAYDSVNSSFLPDGLLPPGESVTMTVSTRGKYRQVSVAAMLVPSNDTFIALNGIDVPRGQSSRTIYVPGYDAGTEENDELCASLPGPGCGGDPGPVSSGEGYVYISNGVQGIGDVDKSERDFNNPVARIKIQRNNDM